MEKRTKERFVRGSQMMGKEGVCVCTPSSSWRLVDSSQNGKFDKQHLLCRNVSARKVGADLWESFPVCKLGAHKGDKISSQAPKHQTEGATGLMSEAARTSVQLLPARRRNHYHQPKVSGTDIISSEVEFYNLSDSASSPSIDIGASEPTCGPGRPAEMVKVLNRMWKLENQQISRSSHLGALNAELHASWKSAKHLRRYDHNEQQKVDSMVDKILEGSFSRNCKSRSKLLGTIQALESELDDERRRRKHLETLNRKLSLDIAEVQLSFSSATKELEKERRSCKKMEDLCDKLAKEIIDRQSEVTFAKQRRLKEDKLISRIAKAWLEERIQANEDPERFNSVKLSSEMETFIKAKLSVGLKTNDDLLSSQEERSLYRRSSESFLLNDLANHNPAYEDNSTENELNCFEQHKRTAGGRSTGSSSSIGIGKSSAIKSQLMVKDLRRKYSAAISEHKIQMSDLRALSAESSNPKLQLRSKLTTTPVDWKQHSSTPRLKEGSLESHLLEARKRASRGSKSQNVCK